MTELSKYVDSETIVGGTITYVGWSTFTVLKDGLEYEVRVVHGHSGEELEVREASSSVARRAAETRREKSV